MINVRIFHPRSHPNPASPMSLPQTCSVQFSLNITISPPICMAANRSGAPTLFQAAKRLEQQLFFLRPIRFYAVKSPGPALVFITSIFYYYL